MEMFRAIRLNIGRSILKKKVIKQHRIKKFNNLRNSHKIGVIWDGLRLKEFQGLTAFYQEMQKINIQLDIVCYHPGKILPDDYTALRYMTCIKRSDLNTIYFPQADDIIEFLNTPYEILIDINYSGHFPLEYISALSKAEFKVGLEKSTYKQYLDMTIDIPEKEDLKYYLEQVKHYLEMINTGT